jgi:hypothetical protein
MGARVSITAENLGSFGIGLVEVLVFIGFLLLAVHPVIDQTVGRHVQRPDEARSDVLAVSLVKAAFYVAFGFVVNGSLSGSAPNWFTAVAATLVFTVLGGALLIACYVLVDVANPFPLREGVAIWWRISRL